MNKKRIIVNSRDYVKLRQITNGSGTESGNQYIRNLEAELSNAVVIDPEKIPADVITMNTKVSFCNVSESEDFIYTIVYPEDADIEHGKLSVLAPIGTALLGYREGDEVAWKVPSGIKTFRIEKILYQPEANGDYYI